MQGVREKWFQTQHRHPSPAEQEQLFDQGQHQSLAHA